MEERKCRNCCDRLNCEIAYSAAFDFDAVCDSHRFRPTLSHRLKEWAIKIRHKFVIPRFIWFKVLGWSITNDNNWQYVKDNKPMSFKFMGWWFIKWKRKGARP
jgi:hypothetical protein